ncbi:MAG: hypothetical protein ABI614_27040 [Planctomycetota bacterium]
MSSPKPQKPPKYGDFPPPRQGLQFRHVIFVLIVAMSCVATAIIQNAIVAAQNAAADAPDLHNRLVGAWILRGKPDAIIEPKPGARMKFFSDHHWLITEADPETGKVIWHHGGTYTLDGNKLVTKTTFANESTMHMIGSEHRFTVKVDGDTYTQIGEGNPWTEVWKRPAKR